MLINKDFVGYMAAEVIKKLTEQELVEVKNAAALTLKVRQAMMDVLVASDDVEYIEDRDTIRQKIVTLLTDSLREEEKAEVEVRKKISSQKKEIMEGSEEWDLLYRKYYTEELRRMGVQALPDEHQHQHRR